MSNNRFKSYGRVNYRYRNPASTAALQVWQKLSPQQELRINNHTTHSPTVAIHFDLYTFHQYWSNLDRSEHEHSHTKSLHLSLNLDQGMPFDAFIYGAMQDNLKNWGEVFDEKYRHIVIQDMIGKVGQMVDDECNKGRQHLDVMVDVVLIVYHAFDGMPVKNMELDENAMKDDCVICLEELGKERELMRMSCSHVFHGDCFTTWLESGNSCPVCRYELLDI